jgi:hypothetical protein
MKFRDIKTFFYIFPFFSFMFVIQHTVFIRASFDLLKISWRTIMLKGPFLTPFYHNSRFSVQMQLWTIRKSKLNESNVLKSHRKPRRPHSWNYSWPLYHPPGSKCVAPPLLLLALVTVPLDPAPTTAPSVRWLAWLHWWVGGCPHLLPLWRVVCLWLHPLLLLILEGVGRLPLLVL